MIKVAIVLGFFGLFCSVYSLWKSKRLNKFNILAIVLVFIAFVDYAVKQFSN